MQRRKEQTDTEIKKRLGSRREDKKMFGLAQGDLFNQRVKPGPRTGQ